LKKQENSKFQIKKKNSKDFATKLYKTYLENAIEGKYHGKSNQVATFTKRKIYSTSFQTSSTHVVLTNKKFANLFSTNLIMCKNLPSSFKVTSLKSL
jgi:hypothetical protein